MRSRITLFEEGGSPVTLSYAHGACDRPLLGDTIGESLERTAARVPDAEALVSVHQGVRYTYAELNDAVDRLARGMLAAGIRRGDRVGVWSPNRSEWPLVQFATAKVGVILVNINPSYRRSELEYVLGQSGCRWLIAAQTCRGSDYVAMVQSIRDSLPSLERTIFFDTAEWAQLLEGGAAEALLRSRLAELDFDDPINIQYTSGTTGFPKGATLSHHNILNNGYFSSSLLGYTEADRVCIPVPLYHCFGMVLGNLGCVAHGACMVYPAETFDPEATLHACAQEHATSLYGVPTMFIAELEHPRFREFDLSALRTGIMAGSPCPIEVMKRVSADMGIDEMGIAFGMTETSPASTQVRRDDTLEHRCGTVGEAMPHTEIKIVDPVAGRTQPRGEPGEFLARGYLVMRGYWNDPERTAEAIDAQRWMHTGDLATMDDDGHVRIVGRIKDMIIRGGENVYPREIEEFLYTHPEIADVQVIGVPDERYGEELMALVVVREGGVLTEDGVRDFCRDRIAHFKIPRYVKLVSSFPRGRDRGARAHPGVDGGDRVELATGPGRAAGGPRDPTGPRDLTAPTT
jgi:fatty-acyl-CoA synthase